MNPPTDFRKLSDDEWKEFERRADDFAAAVRRGQALDWSEFLDGVTGNLRIALLHEFIKIDLEESWKAGKRAFVDDYLRRFPELGGPYELPVHLVYEEYRVRSAHGDQPDSDSYLTRFPHLAETLRGLFSSGSGNATRHDRPLSRTSPPSTQSRTERSINIPRAPAEKGSTLPAIGEYQLMHLLGQGQFGSVWKARAPGGVDVAVKIITQPADRESAKRELQALELVKNLKHPCLMSTLGFWEHENKLHIVVELADGTLNDRLKQCKAEKMPGIPAEEMVKYFGSAAEGLDYLHDKHVFHRDIKPDNILLVAGHAKVADFGLARAQDQRADVSVSFAGTPVYMAPEVWGGKFNPRSDQYSLAVTYAELRLGRRIMDAKDFVELMSQQLDAAPDLKGMPPAEAAVVARALAKSPEKRFPSCVEFVNALKEAVADPNKVPAKADKGTKVPLLPLLIAFILLIGGGVALTQLWPSGTKGDTSKADNGHDDSNTKKQGGTDDNKNKQGIEDKKGSGTNDTKKDPPQTALVPAGLQVAAGSKDVVIGNRAVASRVEGPAINGIKPTFVLIVPPPEAKLDPFWIMETKVWRGQMAQYIEADTGSAADARRWLDGNPRFPATEMTVLEARGLARKMFGGRLPDPRELDWVIGFRLAMNGPLAPKDGTAHIGSATPRPIDFPSHDVTPDGLSDLFGNGREWTNEVILLEPGGPRMKLPDNPDPNSAVVVLRGRNYTLRGPLTREILAKEQQDPQTQYAGKRSRYTGFRVVIPVPRP